MPATSASVTSLSRRESRSWTEMNLMYTVDIQFAHCATLTGNIEACCPIR